MKTYPILWSGLRLRSAPDYSEAGNLSVVERSRNHREEATTRVSVVERSRNHRMELAATAVE